MASLSDLMVRARCSQTGKSEEVRSRSQRDHEVVVIKFMRVALLSVDDRHALGGEVDLLHFAVKEPHVLQEFSNGIDDVGHVEIAHRHFMQHRREQRVILAVNDRDASPRISGDRLFQAERSVESAEPGTKYQNPFGLDLHFG
jgi:hypothetical protein